ncbi:CHAT domain-containing protein, partial [Streptomyces sp. NPDC003483]
LAGVTRPPPQYPRNRSNPAQIQTAPHAPRPDPPPLPEAARAARRAVAATPAGHPNLVQRHAVLATVRRLELVDATGRRPVGRPAVGRPGTDADAAGLAVPAVTGTGGAGAGTRERPGERGRPAGAGVRRRPGRRERRALRAWVHATGQAYAATPDGHVLRGLALLHHGSALATKAVTEGDARAREAAIALYRRAARDPAMDVSVRVGCARLWALSVLDGGGDSPASAYGPAAAMEPYRLAVELLPRTASYRVGRMDRARQLGDFAGLACDAAACALDLAELRPPATAPTAAGAEPSDVETSGAELALRLLEQGRGVLLGQALDTRTETSELLSRLPDELASEWARLIPQLDRPEASSFTSPEPGGAEDPAEDDPLTGEDRHTLAERWERLVATIRREPGCEDFLRLPRTDEMLAGIGDTGPVVVVNVSPLRCDALVLYQGRVRPVRLERLRHAEAERRAAVFLAAIRATGDPALPLSGQRDAQGVVRETLDWLWTALAEPVLAALTAWRWPGGDSGGEPGRLWWVPTGPLTALPLHAAGRHGDAGDAGDSLLDRAVCSYAPTVNSLVHARRREAARPDRSEPAAPLVVAVAAVPGSGSPPLEGVQEEAGRLARLPGARLLLAEDAVRRSVLDALPRHAWAHFACHAVGALSGAAAGHVVLHDHATAPLTLSDIARLRLPDAELAYLSACETTSARREFADEALHITGAFHMAGFTHVVGTLWAVADDTSLEVSDRFYAAFGTARPFPGRSAHALREAVRGIRDHSEGVRENPSLWAPYIHVGP